MSIQMQEEISKKLAIDVLENLGYKKIDTRIGESVILTDILQKQISNINKYEYNGKTYEFKEENIKQAVKDIDIELTSGLISTNEKIYDLLTIGKSYQETMSDNSKKSYDIKYIDFEHPENNVFNLVEEFTVTSANCKLRLDIVLFINGIPIAVIECKHKEECLEQAIMQMIKYQKADNIQQLFKFIQVTMITNEEDAKYGTCGTEPKLWSTWREDDDDWLNKKLKQAVKERKVNNQDKAIVSLFSPERILDIIKNYIIFEDGQKKICRYQQYFTVKSILKRVNEFDSKGNRKGGVVWHTQGSGKSITMAYVVKQILNQVNSRDAKIVVVTDRTDLDSQIYKIFNKIGVQAVRATTGQNLVQLIENSDSKVITTVANKFEAAVKSDLIVESKNVFILIDEAHRSQYGAINNKMQKVFKNATYISFTGTPLMKKDKDTFKKFGDIIKPTYTVNEAIKDKAIVPLIYEARIIEPFLKDKILNKFDEVRESDERIHEIALDINKHYMDNLKGTGFNAILACDTITQAIKYFNELKAMGSLKVGIIISISDEIIEKNNLSKGLIKETEGFYYNLIKEYKNAKEYEDITKYDFINGNIDILIVVNKLLTGFDAPRASVIYIDKNLSGHTLLQAIARVNRICEGKDFGYIIDYRGLLKELNEALTTYSKAGLQNFSEEDLKSAVYFIDSQIKELEKAYKNLVEIFKDINNKQDIKEYEMFLESKLIRQNFYNKLHKFKSLLRVIFSSENACNKLEMKTIEKYKRDLEFYQTLEKKVKERYLENVNNNEYENKIQKIKEKVTYPKNIKDEERAIYGIIYNTLKPKLNENCTLEEIGEMAINIKEGIEKRIKRDWHNNKDVHNSIRKFIDDEIYIYTNKKHIKISFNEIDALIENILNIAKKIY